MYSTTDLQKCKPLKILNDYLTIYIIMTSNWYIIEGANSKWTYIKYMLSTFNIICNHEK